MKRKLFNLFVVLMFVVSLYACGGGGSSSVTNTSTSVSEEGVFVDAPVDGINYKVTLNGDVIYEGVTDDGGKFKYADGSSVEFYLGDILLGSTEGKGLVTTYDLAQEDQTLGLVISSILQMLDGDGDLSNGIQVDISKDEFDNISSMIQDNNIQDSVDSLLGILDETFVQNTIDHLNSYNLYGEYETPDNISLSCNEKVEMKLIFSMNRGFGYIRVFESDGSIEDIDIYEFEPYQYTINSDGTVTVRLSGTTYNDVSLNLKIDIDPNNPDTVDIEVEGADCVGTGTLQRNSGTKVGSTESIDNVSAFLQCEDNITAGFDGTYKMDNASIDLIECERDDTGDVFIDEFAFSCNENVRMDEDDYNIEFAISKDKCKVNVVADDEGIDFEGFFIPGTTHFYMYVKEENDEDGIYSPNILSCDYDAVNQQILCDNFYIDFDLDTGELDSFAFENLIFDKQ